MKLQRIDHWPRVSSDGQSAEWVAVESCDGEYYRAADVDALLARIREAVAAERRTTAEEQIEYASYHIRATEHNTTAVDSTRLAQAEKGNEATRAALDALLNGVG